MTILLRQYREIYERTLLEFLKEGIVPSHTDIIARAGGKLPNVSSPLAPVYRYKPQTANAVFDINLYNEAINDISTDLKVLFEELGSMNQDNIKRIMYADLFHTVHTHELNRLTKQLDSLIFAMEGGDENFAVQFESFNDLTKINQTVSSNGIVDLADGSLSLPISLQGSYKISLNHLANSTSPSISLSKEDASLVGTVPGTKYGNTFADKIQSWAIKCTAPTDGALELSFTFKLSVEEFINRITVTPHSGKPQLCSLLTSVDSINKKGIKDYAAGIMLDSQYNDASFDFEDRLVEYIHVTLRKESADSEKDGQYEYMFGLKNISVYTTGRETSGYYQSKVFDFSDNVSSIGKISLKASELIPDDTVIDWSIALANEDNTLATPLIPVTPQNRNVTSGPPKVIALQDALLKNTYFNTNPGDAVNVVSFQNIDFYNIKTLTDEPEFGSAKLYRGNRCWFRDQSQAVNPVLVKDNYIPFSKGDTQQLYQVRQEVANASKTDNSAGGSAQSVVVLNYSPLYDSNKGHQLIPPVGTNPDSSTDPIYSVYRATLSSSVTNVTVTGQDFSSGNQVDLGLANIIYTGPGNIVIANASDGKVYQDGYDYIMVLDDEGKPTGVIQALESSANDTGPVKDLAVSPYPTVNISYTVDPDLTRFVNKITGKQVFFNLNVDNLPSSQIVIKYRHAATNVIKSSIKVKGLYGAAGNLEIYTQGKDYIYDSTTAQIQRLTTGGIPVSKNVYIDYKFNDLSDQLNQFFIWGRISDGNTISLKTEKTAATDFSVKNKLKPDSISGEQLLAQIPGVGLVDLTNAVEWPELSGWVQFVVRSLPPEDLINSSKVPFIHQVMQMKDEEDNFVFIQGGKYFEELTGIREPMNQVGFTYLKTNVLKNDNSKFAIKKIELAAGNQYQVIINFEPNTSSELYQYGPIGEGSSQAYVDGLYPINESWKITWSTKNTTADTYTKLVVAAALSRSAENTNGNITPKVFDYFIKIGF